MSSPSYGIDGDADAGVDEDLVAGHPNRMGKAARGSGGPACRRPGLGKPGHDDGELVAAQSGHFRRQRIDGGSDLVLPLPAAGPEPDGHLLQELVAHLMAQRIVDPAEVVEVDEECRHQRWFRLACSSA